jgi:hypothetical protein
LLSADALAKLNDYYERERTKTNNQRGNDDYNEQKERRQQRTRDIAAVEDEDGRIRVEKRREHRRPPSQQLGRRISYREEKKTFYDNDHDAEQPVPSTGTAILPLRLMYNTQGNELLLYASYMDLGGSCETCRRREKV